MLIVCLVSVCLSLRESSGSEILTCKELCMSTPYRVCVRVCVCVCVCALAPLICKYALGG